jgi:single-stranded DNA-binding protein
VRCLITRQCQSQYPNQRISQIKSIIGRLTKDGDLKYSESGTAIYKNSIAVNRKFKKDEADFINLVAFQKTAELWRTI